MDLVKCSIKTIFLIYSLLFANAQVSATTYIQGVQHTELRADDVKDSVLTSLGFNFEFYGRSYDSMCANSNGVISLTNSALGTCLMNTTFSNTLLSGGASGYNNSVMLFWDDLIGYVDGSVSSTRYASSKYLSSSDPSNPYGSDVFIFQYTNWGFYSQVKGLGSVSVTLVKNTNQVILNYLDLPNERSQGGSATIGIVGDDASEYSQYSYNQAVLSRSKASIVYTPVYINGSFERYDVAPLATDSFQDLFVYADSPPPSQFSLTFPLDTSSTSQTPNFQWQASERASDYHLYVSTSPDLLNPVISISGSANSYQTTESDALQVGQLYYWAVKSSNSSGEQWSSSTNSFRISFEPVAVDDLIALVATSGSDEIYTIAPLANDYHTGGGLNSLTAAFSEQGEVRIDSNNIELDLSDFPVEELEVHYTIEDLNGTSSSAIAYITIDRSAQVERPDIVQPGEIEVNSTALYTSVNLGTSSATDENGNPIPVSVVGNVTMFRPGINFAYWQATDAHGNTAIKSQKVVVNPLISLSSPVDVYRGSSENTSIDVVLNGYAPTYPFTIPYTVNGEPQSLTIYEGSTASISVNQNLYNTDVITVVLDSALNLGERGETSIHIRDNAVAPKLSVVSSQGSIERNIVAKDQGTVSLSAIVTGSSSYSVSWRSQLLQLSNSNGVSTTFDPSILSEGVYPVSVEAKDLTSNLTVELTFYVEVWSELPSLSSSQDSDGDMIPDSAEGYGDSDGDGIPNYQDAIDGSSIAQTRMMYNDRFLIEAAAGLSLVKGNAVVNRFYGGLELSAERDSIQIDGQSQSSGIYDFIISGLENFGDTATIVVPLNSAIASGATYQKYDLVTDTWSDFVVGIDSGVIGSSQGELGYCPPPGAIGGGIWSEGLTQGHYCVQISIVDGGVNDDDGLKNGSVQDPGGVLVKESPLVDNRHSGGVANFLIILVICIIAVIRGNRLKVK